MASSVSVLVSISLVLGHKSPIWTTYQQWSYVVSSIVTLHVLSEAWPENKTKLRLSCVNMPDHVSMPLLYSPRTKTTSGSCNDIAAWNDLSICHSLPATYHLNNYYSTTCSHYNNIIVSSQYLVIIFPNIIIKLQNQNLKIALQSAVRDNIYSSDFEYMIHTSVAVS